MLKQIMEILYDFHITYQGHIVGTKASPLSLVGLF